MTRHDVIILRSKINKELAYFEQRLKIYDEEPDPKVKNKAFEKIAEFLQTNTQFAAFKRQIIRDTPKLLKEFEDII
jgi:hypothetical protein